MISVRITVYEASDSRHAAKRGPMSPAPPVIKTRGILEEVTYCFTESGIDEILKK